MEMVAWRRLQGRMTVKQWACEWRLIGLKKASRKTIGIDQWCQRWALQRGKWRWCKAQISHQIPKQQTNVWTYIVLIELIMWPELQPALIIKVLVSQKSRCTRSSVSSWFLPFAVCWYQLPECSNTNMLHKVKIWLEHMEATHITQAGFT